MERAGRTLSKSTASGKIRDVLVSATDLLVLERGADEMLICRPETLRPVYLRRGGAFVKSLLKRVGREIARGSLLAEYDQDRGLLQLLEDHQILQSPEQAMNFSPRQEACVSHDFAVTYLTVTTACNLSCAYCLGGKKDRGDSVQKMSLETALRAVEQACEQVTSGGVVEVAFFGGEPLQNWPLVKSIGEACTNEIQQQYPDKEVRLSMVSNLAELPDDLVEWSLEQGVSFLCDIDGPQGVHDSQRPFVTGAGSWAAVTGNVRRLTSTGIPVGLRMTITALNQEHMMETARLYKELGARSCAFVPVQPVDCDGRFLSEDLLPDIDMMTAGLRQVYESGLWEVEELFPLSGYQKRLQVGGVGTGPGCGSFSGQTPVVSPAGDVYPCVYLAGNHKYCVGSVQGKTPFDWMKLRDLHDGLLTTNLPECRRCSWRTLCGGGCSVPRLLIGPDSDAPVAVREYARKVNCGFITAAFELLLWDQATRTHAKLTGDTCL